MDLMTITTYQDLRDQLGRELSESANSFVRIGYLLKKARDTDILDGKGYKDVNEFASAEFGLDKTQVSRFIRINDRFSEGGNSDKIQDKYSHYGSAKLSLMLTLPDEINEELSPEMSKSDIQAIKDDYDEEQKISPIEVALEPKDDDEPDEFLESVVKHLNDEHEEPIIFLHNTLKLAKKMGIGIEVNEADIKEAYMPDGDRTYNIRIPGQGRFMVNIKESGITIVNMRDPSIKSPVTWEEFKKLVLADESTRDFTVMAEAPKKPDKPKKVEKSKPKVAPVQPQNDEKAENNNDIRENISKNEDKCTEIEKVEGEIIEEAAMNPPEDGLEQEVMKHIEKAIEEIKKPQKTNWGSVKDKLQDAIRKINLQV